MEENQKTKILIQVLKLSKSLTIWCFLLFCVFPPRTTSPSTILTWGCRGFRAFVSGFSPQQFIHSRTEWPPGWCCLFLYFDCSWLVCFLVVCLLFFYWLLPHHSGTLGPSGFWRSFTCTIIVGPNGYRPYPCFFCFLFLFLLFLLFLFLFLQTLS